MPDLALRTRDAPPPAACPATARLLARFANAAERDRRGSLVIAAAAAPTPAERARLAERAGELRAALAPADPLRAGALLAELLAGFDDVRRLSLEDAARLLAAYLAGLAGLPFWAVREVCAAILAGRHGALRRAPKPPEIATWAAALRAPAAAELRAIEAALAARIAPPRATAEAREAAAARARAAVRAMPEPERDEGAARAAAARAQVAAELAERRARREAGS